MSDPKKIIAVNGSRHQRASKDALRTFLLSLRNAGMTLAVNTKFCNYLIDNKIVDSAEVVDAPYPDSCGIPLAVISIGGDGTFLRTSQWVADRGLPILGVNTGHLGFLTGYRLDEAPKLIEDLCSGSMHLENRMVLMLQSDALPADFQPYALNEVAILKADSSAMINVSTHIDGIFLADYLTDGLIVSTPTGSTGYNLSAGGPIMQPILDCCVISPVAPHALTMRPICVSGRSMITAVTTSRADNYRVSLDGRSLDLPCGTELHISRAPFTVKMLRRPDANFAATLREKLGWAVR